MSVVRITAIESQPSGGRTLKVEGRVSGCWAEELARATLDALGRTSGVVLDLGGVTFIDRSGAAVLKALRHRGVTLVNETSFIASLLNGESA